VPFVERQQAGDFDLDAAGRDDRIRRPAAGDAFIGRSTENEKAGSNLVSRQFPSGN